MARGAPGLEPNRLPVACGAVGAFDPAVVELIAGGADCDLQEAHRDARSLLLLDRDPVAWESDAGARGVVWPERTPLRADGASSWLEAADAGACGLIVEGDRRAVHASASGIGPVYAMTSNGASYFATRLEPLVRAARSPLEVDWESWASLVVLGYPCGDGTPFGEIKRLPALGAIEDAGRGAPATTAGRLAWADVEPDDAPGLAEEALVHLRSELEALDGSRPLICPLTGGFDSRLLASLLAESGRDFVSFTINNDQGNEREEELAAAVAAELGVPHSTIDWPASSFVEGFRDGAALVEHQSVLRPHLARLGAALPDPSATAVDGFDIFIKNRFSTPAVLAAVATHRVAPTMFDEMTPSEQRFPIFSQTAWAALRDTARRRFVDAAERFEGHPNAPTLIPYWHRMRRGIGLAPVALLGRRHMVAMPFLCSDFARTALRVSERAKHGQALYRELLSLVNPRVARLPSTNDSLPRPERTRPRLDRSRRARRMYLELLAESPLRAAFSPELEAAIHRGKLGPVLRSGWGLGRVHALCHLTLWAQRHGDSLAGLDPAPLFA